MINYLDIVSFRYSYDGRPPSSRGHIVVYKSNNNNEKKFLKLQGWKPKYQSWNFMYYIDPNKISSGTYPFKVPTAIDFSYLRCVDGLIFNKSLIKNNVSSYAEIRDEIAKRVGSITEEYLNKNVLCQFNPLISKHIV